MWKYIPPDNSNTPSTPLRSNRQSPQLSKTGPLPSVEFTFSHGTPFGARGTPASAVDDPVEPGVNGRSITPTTTALFQNLRMSETPDQKIPDSEPASNNEQWESRLTPYRQQTTYRHLFNATPSPAGVPSTELSQKQPQTPAFPLSVSFDFQKLNLEESGNTSINDPDRDSDSETDRRSETDEDSVDSGEEDGSYGYNIREEELPSAPVYDIRLQHALRNVRGQLTDLANFIGEGKLAKNSTTALHGLYKATLEASQSAYPATRTVGFIGDSGMGKSSLINSILDQEGLTRSSGDGAACTTVVTEFRSVDKEHPENYTLEVNFMDKEEIRELLQELLSNARKYYTDAYREISDPQEQEEIKTAANRAWETLLSLFPNQSVLDMEFISSERENAVVSIMESLEEWAMASLDYRPGGRNSNRHVVVAEHADECMAQLDNFMTDPKDGDKPALWPFVKLIRVYLGSPVLRTGLILADLPGFRDLNFARVRATERYLRHKCDEVFIVSTITRCTTDKSIDDIVRRCQGQPIRIVCTRSEDVDAKETARTSPQSVAKQIISLDDRIKKLEYKIEKKRSHRRRAIDGNRRNNAANKMADLSEQKEALVLQLKTFLMSQRNNAVTAALTNSYRARVFCVSNKLYSDYHSDDSEQAHEYLKLSGIKELRLHCQSVPADAQLRATESYLRNQVPAILGSLVQWALAGSDPVGARQAEILRGVLNEAEKTLQQSFISDRSMVYVAEISIEQQFRDCIIYAMRRMRNILNDGALTASQNWARWAHQSYAAWCQRNGTHHTKAVGYRCWNEEMLASNYDLLSTMWDLLLNWLEQREVELQKEVRGIFRDICNSIEEQVEMAPATLKNLLSILKIRQRCIQDMIASAMDGLIHKTEKIKMDAIGGHSSSYIVDAMLPTYEACSMDRGTGSDARRKRMIDKYLRSKDLFRDFSAQLANDYLNLNQRAFKKLDEVLYQEVTNVTRDLQASIMVEGEMSEADQDPRYAAELKQRVGLIQGIVDHAQSVVQEVKSVKDG